MAADLRTCICSRCGQPAPVEQLLPRHVKRLWTVLHGAPGQEFACDGLAERFGWQTPTVKKVAHRLRQSLPNGVLRTTAIGYVWYPSERPPV